MSEPLKQATPENMKAVQENVFKNLAEARVLTCHSCGYSFRSKVNKVYATCPGCQNKTKTGKIL